MLLKTKSYAFGFIRELSPEKLSLSFFCFLLLPFSIFFSGCQQNTTNQTAWQKKADSLQQVVNQLQEQVAGMKSVITFDKVAYDSLPGYIKKNQEGPERNILMASLSNRDLKMMTSSFGDSESLKVVIGFPREKNSMNPDSIDWERPIIVAVSGTETKCGCATGVNPPPPPPMMVAHFQGSASMH